MAGFTRYTYLWCLLGMLLLPITGGNNDVNGTVTALTEFLTTVGPNATGNGTNATESLPEPFECKLFRFVLHSIVFGMISLTGFAGNTISFLILQRDRSTPVASFLLQSLAVADNIFLVLWIITYSVRYMLEYFDLDDQMHPTWIYLRVFSFPILYMAQTQTIWLTVIIALNRYMAVCVPYRAPHLCNITNVYKEVAIVTIFAIVYNVPKFFELEVIQGENMTLGVNRTELGSNKMYQLIYGDVMYYLVTFFIPLIILAFVNTRVIVVYNATKRRRQRMRSTSSIRRQDNENNITLVMIMVVVIFLICQSPARIVQLVWGYTYKHCTQLQYYLIHISITLEVLNSSINFLIYSVFHKRFRDILQHHFCCGPLAANGRRNSTRVTTTEGLSLEEVQKTTSASSKKGSSVKSSSHEQNRNGAVPGPERCPQVSHDNDAIQPLTKEDAVKVEQVTETAVLVENAAMEHEDTADAITTA